MDMISPATLSAAYICELCDKSFEVKQSLAFHKHRIHGLQLLGVGAEGIPRTQLYEEMTPKHQEVSQVVSKTPEMPVLLQEVTPPTTINKDHIHKNVKVTEKNKQLKTLSNQGNVTSSDETSRKSKRISLASSTNIQQPRAMNPTKDTKHGKAAKNKKMLILEPETTAEKVHTVTETVEHTPPQSKNVDTEAAMLEEPALDEVQGMKTDEASDTSDTSRTRGYKKALPCEVCDQKFYLLINLQSHMQERHGAGGKRAKKTVVDVGKTSQDQSNETSSEEIDEVFECAVCFRIFRTKAKFDEHSEKAHLLKSSPAKSDTNPVEAIEPENKTDANTEMRTPTPDTRVMCMLCSSKFRNNIGLTMHIRNVHKKLICPDCHDIFESQVELDDHLLVHELQNNYSTDRVEGPCQTSSVIDVTEGEDVNCQSSPQETIFQCLYCYHSCGKSSQLINHVLRTHKLHGCDECWDAFATKDDVTEHKEHFHSESDPSDKIKTLELKLKTLSEESTNLELKCKVCNANFLFRSALFLHVKKYHKKESCHFCLDIFKPEELETHKSSCNANNKNCNTNVATKVSDGENVGQKASSVVHVKSPMTADKPCSYCERKCASLTELWSHLNAKHSTKVKFQCKICDCIFYDSKEYLLHGEWESKNTDKSKLQPKQDHKSLGVSIVNSNKEPKCPLCSKIFTSSWQHVRRHIVQVHKVQVFRCHQCDKTWFLEEESLKLHIRQEHTQLNSNEPQGNETMEVESSVETLRTKNVKVQPNIATAEGKKMACKYCLRKFALPDLMPHLKNIHPTEFFCLCNMCDTIFFHFNELAQHELDVHANKSDEPALLKTAGPSKSHSMLKAEKVKLGSNQLTAGRQAEVGQKLKTYSKSSLTPSKLPSTSSNKSTSPLKSSPEDTSKVRTNEARQQSQKIKIPFKLKPASPPTNQSTTSKAPQKPKPLKCQFCDEVLFSAATLIDHLQQHAKDSF